MFTGIITDIGTIEKVEQLPEGRRFTVSTRYDTETIDIGASIAHDGVCLTVVEKDSGTFDVEAWEEALRLTTAGDWSSDVCSSDLSQKQVCRRSLRLIAVYNWVMTN